MNQTVILRIIDAITGAVSLLPIGINIVTRVRDALNATGADFQAEILVIEGNTLKALDEADAIIKAWMEAHPEG